MKADDIAQLRLTCNLDRDRRHVGRLEFRCLSCERESLTDSTPVHRLPAGRYDVLLLTHSSLVVLPFELELWQPHLLHDVHALWDCFWLDARAIRVQTIAARGDGYFHGGLEVTS